MNGHGTASAAYRYPQHPTSIHSTPHQPTQPVPWLDDASAACWSPPCSPQLQVYSPAPGPPPPYVLLQPAASHTPVPAVIVSPHSLSPPPSRDSAHPVSSKAAAKTGPARHATTDGKQSTQRSVPPSTSTMTSNGVPNNLASKRDDAAPPFRPQRPSIVSQHSNSVPSTPMQSARKYESHSRSPSPNGGLGSHSPRSVSSEANSTMPSLRLGRPFKCQYETNVGNLGRRRVPYHSSDILEPAKEEPKKTLDPHEDDKLSGDMRELYGRIQPNQAHVDVRDRFVNKVQHILETEFPGNNFTVHIFGSSGNMLWTSESDVDICIQTPMKRLEEMHMLAEALDKHGMQKVVCIPGAKVRIVKVWDPELDINCDINVNNVAALDNTRMIKTYIQIDDRVRPLAMIIKHWTKKRILNDAGIGGTISSYTWICMIINFLQTRDPPILPALHNLPHREIDKATGKPSLSGFADDLDQLRGFGDKNSESLGQLLLHFFRLYGHEVDFEKEAISVRQGKRLKREEKSWHPGGGQKEGVNRLCVEEPFNIDRNLGNSADDYAWRGIHLEIRRAFDLLADGQQLDKACEQFEFPAEEKPSAIFKKPQSQKATITSSVPIRSSAPRGGGSPHRGGRGGFNMKGHSNNGRRSSGGASFAQGRPPFLHSPPLPGSAQQEYFAFPRGIHEQLHDQLYQQYQMLEIQSNSLRAQLAVQQHQQAHQARAVQMQAHAFAQAQAQNRGPTSTNGSPQKSPFMNGRASPHLAEFGIPPNAIPQGFLYHHHGYYNPLQSDQTMSQDGSRTNPSSPSLSNSVPGVRRTVHRVSNASDTGSIRSQSQPPRGLTQQSIPIGYPVPQLYDASTFVGYPMARSMQDNHVVQTVPTMQPSPPSSQPEPAVLPDTSTPKEYVGYCVADQTPPTRPLSDYAVSAIPSFSELAQRRRRVSPEVLQPLLNTALRRASRSPSPLGDHMRNYSVGGHPQTTSNVERKARVDSVRPPVDAGPVIVNGSFPIQPRDAYVQGNATESALPDMPHAAALGIYANNQNIQQIRELEVRQQLVLEEMQRQRAMEVMGPPIVNGSMKGSPHMETNGLTRVTSEEQPFSTLPEGWSNYDSNKGSHNNNVEEVSPKRMIPSQWRNAAYTNGLPSLDISKTPRASPQEVKTANLPLLSPVFETRTPSPTMNRSSELSKLVNGTKAHTKENHHARRASHTPASSNGNRDTRTMQLKNHSQANEKSNKSPTVNNNGSSPWQSQGGKRKKNGRGKKAPEQKTTGEPLPANAADRKGG